MQKHRERLVAIAAGGQAGQYGLVVRGKAFTADQIDALDNTEIEKMYARYEARLGAAMTETLGSAALQLYAGNGTSANIPLKEADQEQAVSADKRPEHREGLPNSERLRNWTPWIIGVFLRAERSCSFHACAPQAAQTSGGTAAGPTDTAPKQLEASPDPFYME